MHAVIKVISHLNAPRPAYRGNPENDLPGKQLRIAAHAGRRLTTGRLDRDTRLTDEPIDESCASIAPLQPCEPAKVGA
ncbi:hypothetical protein [Streptomyces sp. NPDC050704]|uniref:hypothetical protein n=1 Tax=Streptomyces sp. NPDC050704 TaxID=3157219 RepID=UPI00344298D2